MFGRFNEVDDKPDWREKLAEWRASPLWVPRRPEWLAEGLLVLTLLFVGIASLMLAVVYVAVPTSALPSNIPGHWVPPATTSTTSTTSTTTTTVSPVQTRAAIHKLAALSPAQRTAALGYIRAAQAFQKQQAQIDRIVNSPVQPPSHRWAYAFLTAVLGVVLLVLAWLFSDRRARMLFER
jgi:hypothetical protein